MGWDLPAAIGAAIGAPGQRVICLAGDGSLMMNVQDLATVRGHGLNVKLFLLNNDGYHSIRQTQNAFFAGNEIGVGPSSGVTFPDWEGLARAFGLGYQRVASHEGLGAALAAYLATEGPGLCEIVLDRSQPFAPKLSSRRLPDGRMVTSPLEDMAPFLSREELASNLLVPPYEP
jgi:acetolactate synthase-1/2/3 large subunit